MCKGKAAFHSEKQFSVWLGKKKKGDKRKKEKKREIKLCTSSARDLQTQEWKILNEPLTRSDEECYGGEKKRRKQTNKQEWASMGDWLVVTGSICCCASRTRIAKGYLILSASGYQMLTSWGYEEIFPTGHALVREAYSWISLDFPAFARKENSVKELNIFVRFRQPQSADSWVEAQLSNMERAPIVNHPLLPYPGDDRNG